MHTYTKRKKRKKYIFKEKGRGKRRSRKKLVEKNLKTSVTLKFLFDIFHLENPLN